jgi:L-lysine 6-transaminase
MSLTNTSPEKTRWYAQFKWPRVSIPIISYPETAEGHQDLLKREATSIAQIKAAFADNEDDICAIIIEPVQSEGGDNHVRKEFLEQLRLLADENDVMLIYDEIQTGVGITGKFWCHEHFGEKARPDILAFGKKMQVCGILAGKKVDEVETNVFRVASRINSTWGGSLVDMVRATRILEIIDEDNLCNNAAQVGDYLQQELLKLAQEYNMISNVRGKGLLTSFDFQNKENRDKFIKSGMEHGVMFLGCGSQTIRFRPALTMDKNHIDEGIDAMKKVLITI